MINFMDIAENNNIEVLVTDYCSTLWTRPCFSEKREYVQGTWVSRTS